MAGSDSGAYEAFGARFALRPTAPSLAEGGVPVLYDATAATAGGAAAKRELQALHRSLVFNYVELVRALADEPTQAAERVEGVGHVARNLHHLINALRPVQAKVRLCARKCGELVRRRRGGGRGEGGGGLVFCVTRAYACARPL